PAPSRRRATSSSRSLPASLPKRTSSPTSPNWRVATRRAAPAMGKSPSSSRSVRHLRIWLPASWSTSVSGQPQRALEPLLARGVEAGGDADRTLSLVGAERHDRGAQTRPVLRPCAGGRASPDGVVAGTLARGHRLQRTVRIFCHRRRTARCRRDHRPRNFGLAPAPAKAGVPLRGRGDPPLRGGSGKLAPVGRAGERGAGNLDAGARSWG